MTIATDSQPLLLNVSNITLNVTAKQYYALNANNQDLRLELWDKQVEIYLQEQEPEILGSPTESDCGEVMPGFVLSMSRIW